MSFGLSISNPSGELVVDSDARGLHYVGQATYLSDVVRTNSYFVANRYYRRYSFTLASPSALPIVAIRPTTDRWVSVQQVFRSSAGSATWYVDCYSADSTMLGYSAADMTRTASAEVHVFSTHAAGGDAFGMRLFDSAGNPSWDFGAKPLFIRQVLPFPQRTDRAAYVNGDALPVLAGIGVPLLLNATAHGKDNRSIGAVGTHEDKEYVFQLDSYGSVTRALLTTYWERGEPDGSPYQPQPDWLLPARTVFVIDALNYT